MDPRPDGRARGPELQDGFYVNLGIGLPTLVANHVPRAWKSGCRAKTACSASAPSRTTRGRRRPHQCRQADRDHLPGSSIFGSHDSFAMIRGGKINLSILGAMQVSEKGDLANWMIPGKMVKGMGGAMDLVAGVKSVVVLMEHVAKKKDGTSTSRSCRHCTLPLTGVGVVDRIITDLAVLDVTPHGLKVVEMAPGVTREELQAMTGASLK
jgi:3-oxoacid CoA-transferase subunit B